MAEKEKVVYTKPTSQKDLESRLANGNAVPGPTKTVNPGTPEETEDVYVGTDPIYQNHANDTEAPLQAEKGADKEAEQQFLKEGYAKPKVNLDRRKALENGKDQKVLDKPLADKVTEQSSPLFAADPGSGDGNGEPNDGEDEEEQNENPSASPTGSSTPSTPSTPATPNQGSK